MSYQYNSIILPVYNQADHIGQIVASYTEALQKIQTPYEMLLVTNNCRDNSVEICRGLAEQYESVRTINTPKGGWGHAVRLGLSEARGDLLCYTNSARTSPEILTLMLLYGMAFPNTVLKANRKIRDNWSRRAGSLLYNLQCRTLFDLSYWDINGTPKVFPRAFAKLLELKREDDMIDAEFNAICRRENYPMLEVPILITKRHGGKSTTNYNSAFKMYWGAFDLWRSMRGQQA